MLPTIQFDPQKETPIYRQVYVQIKSAIDSYKLLRGERLPATRELAGLLGLNRTTIAAAYGLLEEEGLIRGHVGRGSFVEGPGRSDEKRQEEKLDWEMLIPAEESSTGTSPASSGAAKISFASSRPSEMLFPLDEFRATCREVIDSAEAAQILQLGSAGGYAPLRRYLLEEARRRGIAGPGDDILITSGCQQAFDLLQRVLASHGETVLLEDPVYPGLRNVFVRGGARVVGVPVGDQGVEIDTLARTIEKEKPRLVVLTPNFQNPTGSTMPETSRLAALEMARRAG
ncbi:MAG TPA: PLP-dependent aminotransferase family protein, partial [Bryobacteraceae bacterium]|nr:PLP-dependent aminotransferase family protein [Bryobacteraceae bacterium]